MVVQQKDRDHQDQYDDSAVQLSAVQGQERGVGQWGETAKMDDGSRRAGGRGTFELLLNYVRNLSD